MSSVECIDELTKERSGRVYHSDPFLMCHWSHSDSECKGADLCAIVSECRCEAHL